MSLTIKKNLLYLIVVLSRFSCGKEGNDFFKTEKGLNGPSISTFNAAFSLRLHRALYCLSVNV